MNKSITDTEAAQNLEQVKIAQAEINKRTAKEYAPWIGWGLFIVLFYPPFDLFDPSKWGIVVWVVAIIGAIITGRYFHTRKSRIKSTQKLPRFAWLYYILWIAVGNIFANIAHPHFAFAWTVAGVGIGLPFILYGLKLKSQA